MVKGLPVLGLVPVAIQALSARVDFLIFALAIKKGGIEPPVF